MKPNLSLFIFWNLFALVLFSCHPKQQIQVRDDFKKFYDEYKVEGSFILLDPQTNQTIFYNIKQLDQAFSPASTFKICNALIGLETGVIKDQHFRIKWDSVTRQNPAWNYNQDLETAFKNSTVWYFQELAKRVGGKQMKHWLDKANYGNKDTSGGIDQFWLTGKLRITPFQQIQFLKQLHDNQLPFSQRNMDIVKSIMLVKDTLDYQIRAKTGWGSVENKDLGWYVGYLETHGKVYYFANCIQSSDFTNPNFAMARITIVDSILEELGLIENSK